MQLYKMIDFIVFSVFFISISKIAFSRFFQDQEKSNRNAIKMLFVSFGIILTIAFMNKVDFSLVEFFIIN